MIADEASAQVCMDACIPCASIEELSEDDKKVKVSLSSRIKSMSFSVLDTIRSTSSRIFLEGESSYKLRIKDFAITPFPAWHTGMDSEQVYENARAGMNLVVYYLKKGLQNLKGVVIKTNQKSL